MSLSLRYLDAATWTPTAFADRLLGVVGFGRASLAMPADCPFAAVALPPIGTAAVLETWLGDAPVVRGRHGGQGDWHFAADGSHLLAMVQVAGAGDLAPLTRRLYDDLFDLVEAAGYPHLLRVFNYLPRITAIEAGEERYRRFNRGRHEAFAARRRAVVEAPAACALGVAEETMTLYAIAGRVPGRPIENPRQLSAYRYPAAYGPRSPTFARALVAGDAVRPRLFISGTASIVAHASLHPGDVSAQLAETLRNLRAVLAASGGACTESALQLKVYLRRPQDHALVARELAGAGLVAAVFLQADICREELLLEIEAYGGLAADPA